MKKTKTFEDESKKKHIIYDVLYGFVELTPLEWKIIHTPFYQRLKWIRQLGFSFYTFPGAEHSRFGHSIGVMYNAHCILNNIGRGVPDELLFAATLKSKEAIYHQSIRLAALLHDIGTFPFSHTTEMAYIRYAETKNKVNGKNHPDDHEHLGSYIIKRTKYPGGITFLIEEAGLDPQSISNLVKGIDQDVIANQILHSEVDCDRMDYLLRDAHYTGLHYGAYDRDYLLHHFKAVKVGEHDVLTINEKAIYCIQDFLMSRFAWYSQVIRSARGAKFDALAEEICFQLLKDGHMFRYQELLGMIEKEPMLFYSFNDHYFLMLMQQLLLGTKLQKKAMLKDMIEHLLLAKSPKTIKLPAFSPHILEQEDTAHNAKIVKHASDKLSELQQFLKKKGTDKDWILDDLPRKDIILVKSHRKVVKDKTHNNVLLERDPAKILLEDGNVVLFSTYEKSLIFKLQNHANFLPNVFCSESAYDLLKKSGMLDK